MKATIENGCVKLDIAAMLDEMSTEEKRLVADSLSIQDDIIEDVVSQVLEGWTELSSHAAQDCDAAEPTYALGKAIRRIALGADGVAKRQVEEIVRSLKWHEAYRRRTEEWAWKMYHTMNDANRDGRTCPSAPSWPSANDANSEEYIVVRKSDHTQDNAPRINEDATLGLPIPDSYEAYLLLSDEQKMRLYEATKNVKSEG